MYCITDEQIEYILNDIRRNGVEMEDLQLNLLDHICCKVEQEFKEHDDFERFYKQAVKQLCRNNLHEIEEETINLLTFKNYYVMKKAMMISGGVSTVIFLFGCFFKLMHWPGASVLLLLGIVLISFVFLPLSMLLMGREPNKTTQDHITLITGTLAGILYSMAVLFTVMHWPGSSALWFTTVGVSLFVFIPFYFFTGIRKPEKKLNTIFTSVLLIGATGLIFTMLRVRQPKPVQMYSYIKNEQLLKTMQHTMPNNPDKLVTEINTTCEQLKALVLQQYIGQPSFPANYDEQKIVINEDHMGNFFFTDKTAGALLGKLRSAVSNYNAAAADDNKIPVDHSVIDVGGDNNELFTNISLLNTMTQIQMYVTIAAKPAAATAVAAK
ncbi:MAG: hypothetical protein JWQ38_2874 [Flavipsychrobacter sp.]|nr:hypothetical protein [Flavipsychrobacter sp.]